MSTDFDIPPPRPGNLESARGLYLGVFTSNKRSAKWRSWYALSEEESAAKAAIGVAALQKWDEDHAADIVYMGGPLGPTRRVSEAGVVDAVNELTAFVVVRAASLEAAANLFHNHPHFAFFPCDGVDVMPVLGE